mgnify:CR=1 FL=1
MAVLRQSRGCRAREGKGCCGAVGLRQPSAAGRGGRPTTTGPYLAKALRLAKAARGGRLKDREGVAKPSPIGIFWSSLSRGVFALETAKAVPPYQGGGPSSEVIT